ncbi:MAG: formylmethanofuran--tetrahydromethanopterin N-formyltransferase [Candidatus Promineifilaceae bacterium]|jgi:formylmethanofuran--tetrahydromethanopterin N-formyltransferase
MQIGDAEIVDTFAEAFKMSAARVIITGLTPEWAMNSAVSMTGFATSIIGCKCEAGIERTLEPEETPDGRPGVSVLLFAMNAEGVGKRLLERIGQTVMTCPTTSCFNGLESENKTVVGGQLRFFGDGYQISKVLDGRRYWRIPVMDGEFLVEEEFGIQPAIGGGNLLILGEDIETTLHATETAVAEMRKVPGVILPFPGGIVRSGSKTSSRYKFLFASTNDAYCPTLRGFAPETHVPEDVGCVMEIVIDGLDLPSTEECMRIGIETAAQNGAKQVSAGNYGGTLGQYNIHLHKVLESELVS